MILQAACIAAASAGAAKLVWASAWPLSQTFGHVHYRASPAEAAGRVALTFDDGPVPGATDRVLDALGELGVSATFFVIGQHVVATPRLVERIAGEGHLLGNHSFSHPWLGTCRGIGYWQRQLQRTDDAIKQIIGQRPRWFRPPLGLRTPLTIAAARRLGHQVVTWTRRGLDGVPTTTEKILARLAEPTEAGDILVLHDGNDPHRRRDASATIAAIRPLIRRLRERGLTPVRLDELLAPTAFAPARTAAAAG